MLLLFTVFVIFFRLKLVQLACGEVISLPNHVFDKVVLQKLVDNFSGSLIVRLKLVVILYALFDSCLDVLRLLHLLNQSGY